MPPLRLFNVKMIKQVWKNVSCDPVFIIERMKYIGLNLTLT